MRLPEWENLLSAFIADNAEKPFHWGDWDCAQFATAGAAAITGDDKAAAFRGADYSDAAGAALALRELGAGTLLATLDSWYPRKPVSHAGRGDLVWAENAVGICMGSHGLFLPVGSSYCTVPRAKFIYAWEV